MSTHECDDFRDGDCSKCAEQLEAIDAALRVLAPDVEWDTYAGRLLGWQQVGAQADRAMHRTVTEWRERAGVSYAEIGEALGVSRQAAWERFTTRTTA